MGRVRYSHLLPEVFVEQTSTHSRCYIGAASAQNLRAVTASSSGRSGHRSGLRQCFLLKCPVSASRVAGAERRHGEGRELNPLTGGEPQTVCCTITTADSGVEADGLRVVWQKDG